MVVYPKRETDVWEVRCVFKHSDIPHRIAQCQLKPTTLRRHKANSKQPPGTMTEIIRWDDPVTNEQIAETHHYTLPNGEIGGSGELDPKKVLWNGVLVVAYEGRDIVKRDLCTALPTGPFGWGWVRRLYGWYRKQCCRELGPEGDAALAAKRTPQILWALNVLGIRCA